MKANNNSRVNFVFAIAFIVILLVSGTLGPYITEVSFAQTTQYSSSSFLPSSASRPLSSSTNMALTNVAFISHSHKVSHGDTHFARPNSPLKQTASSSSSTNASLIQITAGKIQGITFTINNNNVPATPIITYPTSLTQLAVSLTSQNTAVRILGPSSWNLPTISSGSGQQLTTQVFASTAAISTPVFFTVTIQYIQNGYQVRTTSFNLGAVVVGLIQLGVNNLNVRYTGNTPTLSGNILNEGNTAALFSSVKMLNQGQGQSQTQTLLSSTSNKNLATILIPSSSQYLGSIAPNSPMPFNIPLQAVHVPISKSQQQNSAGNDNATAALGAYPVSLQITYTDNLKNIHNLIINSTVSLLGIGPLTQQAAVANNPLQGSNPIRISEQQQPLPQLPFGNGFIDSYWAQNVAQSTVNSGTSISANATAIVSNQLPAPLQVQAGPGYGQAILAVVLSNTAFYTIGGITGYLTLPSGFSAATGGSSLMTNSNVNQISTGSSQTYREPQTAIAALTTSVQVGQTYTLYFKVNIGNTATVGSHLASLKLYYYQLPLITPGQYNLQTVPVPFNLPGTVVLDVVPKTTTLNPGDYNHAIIELVNRGTASAHNVVATIGPIKASNVNPPSPGTLNTNATTGGQILTINPPSLIPTINVGPSTFHVGAIPVNGTDAISPILYPADSASGTLQNFNLTLTYIDAGGNTQTSAGSVGFLVLPQPPQAGLNVSPSNGLSVVPSNGTTLPSPTSHPHPHSHSGNNVKGSNSASGLAVSASYTTPGTSPKTINNNTINNNVRIIPAVYKVTRANNNSNTVTPTVSSITHIAAVTNSSSSNSLPQNTNSQNNLPKNTTSSNPASSHQNNTALILTALKEEDMKFHITNFNNFPITDLVVSISSQSGDVKIVGDDIWTVPVIAPHTTHEFTTKVYASTSLIATPVAFNVLLQYVTQGQSEAGSFVLGATVIGSIIPSVSGGLAINFIAGVPNIVGNLLNEGTTTGLFTTVEMVNQPFHPSNTSTAAAAGGKAPPSSNQQSTSSSYSPSSLPPPQYLGDLQSDSPLPFSIPLTVDINNTAPGTYPVILKVSYSDDLHNPHVEYLHYPVVVAPHPPPPTNNGGPLGFLGLGGSGGSHLHGGHGGGSRGILGIPLPILLIIIATIIIAVIFIRRRRKSKQKLLMSESGKEDIDDEGGGEDIESLIDSGKKKGASGEAQL